MTALFTIILSFIGALVCGLMPASAHRRIRWVALAFAAAGLLVYGLVIWTKFRREMAHFGDAVNIGE